MNSRDLRRGANSASKAVLVSANHGSSAGYAAQNMEAMIEHESAAQEPVLPPKIVLYSHDTFGMGNIRRTLLLAQEFLAQYPEASILIITGSPVIHAFRIPEGVDYIKLPGLDREESEHISPHRALSARGTRAAIIKASVLQFGPDLMIVDKRPAGVDGELIPTLKALREEGRQTKLVVGIRDILDEPERARQVLLSNGTFEVIEEFYDEVWIYGSQSIFDTSREYTFPQPVARKTHFCGYLKRSNVSSERSDGPPRILVTTGSGGNGSAMIEAYLTGLATLPRKVALRSTVIFGPQMPAMGRQELLQKFDYLADVTFLDFEADVSQHYAESDLVVAHAGYNTVCELFSFSKRAILVPRTRPVQEQLIRARLLAERGYFELIEPEDLTSQLLIAKVLETLNAEPTPHAAIDLDGLPRIRQRVNALLHRGRRAA
jgi:predicted glycosyltransferase